MIELFKEIWATVQHNKLRTALTGFAVGWGIFILIFLLALILFARECARLYRMRDEANARPPRRAVPRNVQIYTLVDALCEWPVVLCVLLSIVGFIVL